MISKSLILMLIIAKLCCSFACCQTWNAFGNYSAGNMLDPWDYVSQFNRTMWDETYNFYYMLWDSANNSWYTYNAPYYYGYQSGAWTGFGRLATNSCRLGGVGTSPGQGFLVFKAPRSGKYRIYGDVYSYAGAYHVAKAFIASDKYGEIWNGDTNVDFSSASFDFTKDFAAGDVVYFGNKVTIGAGAYQSCPEYWNANVNLVSTSNYHEVWSGQSDFNPNTSPAHDWSYVYQSGAAWNGNWNLFGMTKSVSYPGWWEATTAPYDGFPLAGVTSEWSRVKVSACKYGGGGKYPALGLLQWTAPQGGYYNCSGSAYIYPATNSRLFVYSNRLYSPIMSVDKDSAFSESAFNSTVLLNKGDRIVFGGQIRPNGNGIGTYGYMNSYWTAHISRVPHVPAPWTAITTSNNSVSCWNRTYDFSSNVFPSSIISGGVNLLSGPISLVAKIGGITETWGPATYTLDEVAPDVVRIITTASSANLKITCRTTFEFDGFMLFDVTLKALSGAYGIPNGGNNPLNLTSLELVIPFNPDVAKFFHHDPVKNLIDRNLMTDPPNCGAFGTIPPGGWTIAPTTKNPSSFVHHIWVGDESRGLQWFAESDKGLSPPAGRFVLVDSNKRMTLSLVSTPRIISTNMPFRYIFGIMASPVKPMPSHDDIRWAWYGTYGGGHPNSWRTDYYGAPVNRLADSWLSGLNAVMVNVETLADVDQDYFGSPTCSNPDLWNPTAPLQDYPQTLSGDLIRWADYFGIGVTSWTGVWLDYNAIPGGLSGNPPAPTSVTIPWQLMPNPNTGLAFTQEIYVNCQNGPWKQWNLGRCVRMLYEKNLDGFYLDVCAEQSAFLVFRGVSRLDQTPEDGAQHEWLLYSCRR